MLKITIFHGIVCVVLSIEIHQILTLDRTCMFSRLHVRPTRHYNSNKLQRNANSYSFNTHSSIKVKDSPENN